jgi:hypothetical protein
VNQPGQQYPEVNSAASSRRRHKGSVSVYAWVQGEGQKVLFCSYGSRENAGNINSNDEAIERARGKNTAYVSPETAHEFLTWRRSLREFAPLLFKDKILSCFSP